jgi:dTMP kinase
MKQKFLFIVIEGLDGSGKSTAARELVNQLNADGDNRALFTFEPNDHCIGGLHIRQVLKKQIPDHQPSILPLAYAANRLDHCHRIVTPHLLGGEGRIVVSDRYYLSSLVYQSRPDFSFDKVMTINAFALKPDAIFFINVDTQVCYERMKIRNEPPELFEANLSESRRKYFEAIDYLRQTRQENIIEIDGSGTVTQVVTALKQEIGKLFLAIES